MPRRTFHKAWATRFDRDWRFAFRLFNIGVPAFIVMLAFAGAIKFHEDPEAWIPMVAILGLSAVAWYTKQRKYFRFLLKTDVFGYHHQAQDPDIYR